MDGVLQIGPVVIPTARALALALFWAFVAIGAAVAVRTESNASRISWIALLVGLVAARLGYVAANFGAFMIEPASIVAFWQGGFLAWPGIAAAAAVIAMSLGRSRAGVAMLATLGVLTAIHVATYTLLAPEARPMPPRIALADLNGRWTELDHAEGEPRVINLWATWCPPCRREMPMVMDVAKQSTVPVLLANQGESVGQIRAYLAQEGLSDDGILTDPAGLMGEATGSPALPTTLFVDRDGNVARIHTGEISRAALTAAIRDLERN